MKYVVSVLVAFVGAFGLVAADAQAHRKAPANQLQGEVVAYAAHWKATWTQIDNNLIQTKLDDSCGNGVGYCNGGMYANFGSWTGKHSVRSWIGWNEAQQCVFCDTNWTCKAHVRVVAHWEGGTNSARYNIKEVYSYDAGNPGDGRCKVPWEFV